MESNGFLKKIRIKKKLVLETQVHFELRTPTSNRVFLHYSIDTFTQVENVSTFYTTVFNNNVILDSVS